MKHRLLDYAPLLVFFFFFAFTRRMPPADSSHPITVACIGASITEGARLPDPAKNSYPGQLQMLLGPDYVVHNYGVSSATLLRKGDLSYQHTKAYQAALRSNPDIVFIDLGGNDAKLVNRIHLDEFEKDYHDLIHSFSALPTHPRIILLLPFPSFDSDTTHIWDPVIVNRIIPRIREVAMDEKLELLDMHSLFVDRSAHMPDHIHPDLEGTTLIAHRLYDEVTMKRDLDFNILRRLPQAGKGWFDASEVKQSNFYGYTCSSFHMQGRDCRIVQPRWTAVGHPWIWRARFWGHEPQTDIALLERGYHVVYCDVAELFGNKEAIASWNAFYVFLHRAGLSGKAAMEGMSRGGVYVFNWAAVNPHKIASVYVDNPVLDLKSWPGGLGRVPAGMERAALMRDYGIADTGVLRQFKGSPLDKIAQIVKGQYPILVLCADADEAVPPEENTLLFEKKIKALGGRITVMHKPGFKHHPHSLPDPSPIVDFIIKAGTAGN